MEELITVDGRQYILSYSQSLAPEQRSQAIANIKREAGCGCDNKTISFGGIHSLQPYPCATVNLISPEITVTDIKVGGIDCPGGICPDMTCTSIGCMTDTRDITVTYSNAGTDANIIPYLTASKHSININDAVKNGGSRLIQTQNNDGTWEWSSPDTDPTTTSYPAINNTLGVTARGLVSAYSVTGNLVYLNAAKKTADLLVSKTPDGFGPDDPGTTGKHKVYGQDITFLSEFANAWTSAGNDGTPYSTQASSYLNFILTNPSRYCQTGCPGESALASAIVSYCTTNRTPNLYGWDIKAWVEAAIKVGNTAFAQALVANMAPFSGNLSKTATGVYPQGSSYVLGIAGYLQSYILVGADYSAISDMYTKLLAELDGDGSFKLYSTDPTFDGKVQTAAYALMALDLTSEDVSSTVNYLVGSQSPGGHWIESDGIEYTEVDSEVIVALGASVVPYHAISPMLLPGGLPTDITFSSVVLSRGSNHLCADWT